MWEHVCQFITSMLKFDWLESLCSHAGLGRKKGRDDEWIEHQDAFDQILAELNAKQGKLGGFILVPCSLHILAYVELAY